MDYKQVRYFDAIGDMLWAILLPCWVIWLGSRIPNIPENAVGVILIIVLITLLPTSFTIASKIPKFEDRQSRFNRIIHPS